MENLNIVFVIILIGGWIGGRFFSFIRLPAVLGMMLFGVAAGLPHGSSSLSAAVLSILITAPAGLLLIKYLGPRLLDTEFPEPEEEAG